MASLKSLLPEVLQTERLSLELFAETDEQFNVFIAGVNGEQSREQQGDYGIHTPSDVMRRVLSSLLKGSWLANGIADTALSYFIRPRETGRLVGLISVQQRYAGQQLLPPDIGWMLIESEFGHGYASEAAAKVKEFCEQDLGIKDMCALVNERNKSSARLAQKLGFGGTNQVFVKGEEMWAPLWVLPHMGTLDIKEPIDFEGAADEWEAKHGKWEDPRANGTKH